MTFDIQTLPKSTQDYLKEDGGTKSAVDALLEKGLDKLPDLTDWNELNLYYKARAAAELTKVEWAQSMHMLWQYIWGGNIDTDWKMASIKNLAKYQQITIEKCWEESTIELLHVKNGHNLFTAINLSPTSLTLAFGLEGEGIDDYIVKGDLENFIFVEREKDDWGKWNYREIQGNILSDSNLIEQARKSSSAAIEHCNKKIK